MDGAQFGVGVESEVVGEAPLHGLEVLDRLDRAPDGVEGAHELGGEALAGGVLGDGQPQLWEDLGAAAEFEFDFEALFEEGEPVLVEAAGDGLGQAARDAG
ncbi:hypothetical protein GCM10029992_66750 [Glycomyces albus]